MCIYVVIIYSLLKPVFHVKISHILLQIDLKHQFFLGTSPPSPHGDPLLRPCKGTFAATLTPAVSFSSNFLTAEWKVCYMSASPSKTMSSSHYPPPPPFLTPPSYSLKLRHRNIYPFTPFPILCKYMEYQIMCMHFVFSKFIWQCFLFVFGNNYLS